MNESNSPCLIAVDGGGTSCRVAVVCDGVRTEISTGAANVASDRNDAIATIDRAISALAEKVSIPVSRLRACPAYLGLAGVMNDRDGRAVASALSLKNAVVADDRIATVLGALDTKDGVVAGIGTGSFLARQHNGRVHLIGGYGLGLGDDASGAWLGRALLARVLHVVDGLAEASPLTKQTLADFDAMPNNLSAFSTNAAPRDYGRFAPDIVRAAGNGDPVATELMHAGAAYISRGLRALGWQPGERLCLTGGVGPHYRPYLPLDMAECSAPPKGSGLDGALRLAAQITPHRTGDPA